MGHYAKVVNGKVTNVIVAKKEFFDTFVDDSPGAWIKTSYNTKMGVYYNPETNIPSSDQSKALRKNFAGIGYTYDHQKDAFIPPKPYESWVLNNNNCVWEPPTPCPNDGKAYTWDEPTTSWLIHK
tara:strand:+ start:225 stop:599 length:375 start_codon:yes stop_codon:yes gene_type:complete